MSIGAPDLLATIVAATRVRVDAQVERVPLQTVRQAAATASPARPFREALARADRVNVIAECKRRSPSRGVLRREYDPVAIARRYEDAGAAAVSVLTEPTFFDGELDHLRAVRDAIRLPLLRKDFIVSAYQLWEARAAGADAVLLIAAALGEEELAALQGDARAIGLDALVEVHDDAELARALAAGADLVGVNSRNLRTLAVDVHAPRRLARLLPSHVVGVAESGLRSAADLLALREVGYSAFLVGEHLMTAADPGSALRELVDGATTGLDRGAVGGGRQAMGGGQVGSTEN
jgi:indole-3-glycerol phosphate synthase